MWGQGTAVLTALEEGEVRSPMRPWSSELARGLLLIPRVSADVRPGGPAPVFLQNLVGSSGGFQSRSHRVMRRLLPQLTLALGTSHLLPQSQAFSSMGEQLESAKGRKREEAREREGKDRGRRQVIWNQTSGDVFREAGKQVLAGEHSSPWSWKAGMLTLILAQT